VRESCRTLRTGRIRGSVVAVETGGCGTRNCAWRWRLVRERLAALATRAPFEDLPAGRFTSRVEARRSLGTARRPFEAGRPIDLKVAETPTG
jgi:hypothetical protein